MMMMRIVSTLVLLSALGAACGGSSHTASSSSPSTPSTAVSPQQPTAKEVGDALSARLDARFPTLINQASCTHPLDVWRCTDTAAGSGDASLVVQVSASGATVEKVGDATERALAVRQVAAKRAHARTERRRRVAARGAAQRAARRRHAAHARLVYCHQIKSGEHNGLTIRQVVSYCGKPDRRQHIAVTGLTTDFLYYGGFTSGDFSGRTYQLAFTNGLLTSANYY